MDADLDTFVTALYVTIDDALRMRPELRQRRPSIGLAPKLSDAELLTLAVLQALLGFTSETRFLRHAEVHLRSWFPYIPHQSGYNKRLRKAEGQLKAVIRLLAATPSIGRTTPGSLTRRRSSADARVRPRCAVTSPVGLLRLLRQPLALLLGAAAPSRVHPGGVPVTFALASPKIDEHEVARDLFETEPTLLRPGQRSSPTRAIAPTSSRPSWPATASSSSDPPTRTIVAGRRAHSSSPCVSSSNPSTPRSRPSSISNVMAAEPQVV